MSQRKPKHSLVVQMIIRYKEKFFNGPPPESFLTSIPAMITLNSRELAMFRVTMGPKLINLMRR
jgi:hypothetical protein